MRSPVETVFYALGATALLVLVMFAARDFSQWWDKRK